MMRGIREGLKILENLLSGRGKRGRPYIVLELPTGYGKSTSGPLVYDLLSDYYVPEGRIVHVLPLRAIVEDLANDFYKKLGDKVAYQAGLYLLTPGGEPVPKSPLFDADYNITTFDSFIHNLHKIPVTEIYDFYKHYYISFERVYTSTVIMDEAHMLMGEDSIKTTTAFLASLRLLQKMGNPIIIMTATLTESLRNAIRQVLGEVKFVRLSPEDREEGNTIFVHDKDFEDRIGNTKYTVKLISMNDMLGKVLELVEGGRRVLVVINHIDKIGEIYVKLKEHGLRVGIIHSEMTRRDRERVRSDLKEKRLDVLVGTSAIEAGVNVSFDALVTVPDNPAGLVQRVGRICRYGDCSGELYLVCSGSGIGELRVNRELCKYLGKHGNDIKWRLPYPSENSYVKILEEFSGQEVPTNEEVEEVLKYLSRPYISQGLIQHLFGKVGFNLAREALIEVYTRGKEEFTRANPMDVILDSFSTDLGRLAKWEGCGEGIGYLGDEGPVMTNYPVDRFFADDLVKVLSAYEEFVRRYRASPVLIIRPDCYFGG